MRMTNARRRRRKKHFCLCELREQLAGGSTQRGWSGCADETKTGESYTHTHTHLCSLPPLPEIKKNEIRLHKCLKSSSGHVLGKKNKKKTLQVKKKRGTLSLPSLLNLIDC